MKIITLNTWGGRAGKEGLLSFASEYKNSIDVFCFQEIWSAPYEHLDGHDAGGNKINNEETMVYGMQEISGLLSNHKSYFHPHHLDNYGLMMSVSKDIFVEEEGEVFVHKHKGYVPTGDVGRHARNLSYIKTSFSDKPLTIINFHGLWNGMGKGDSDERLVQSRNIINLLKTLEGEILFCGDFNLLPETESLKMFEDFGLRNNTALLLRVLHTTRSRRSSLIIYSSQKA